MMFTFLFSRLCRAVKCCSPRFKHADKPDSTEAGLDSVEIRDDFTVIRGIGKATQERLYAAGITSYAALAERTPEAILLALGRARPRLNVERWIRRARDLAAVRQT